jgi:transposase
MESKPTTRRYSPEVKERAVRLVLALRAETGEKHGSVKRVADQLGIGVESLRSWVNQTEIDSGDRVGTTTADAEELKVLRQEVKELRRANGILRSASAFFAAELDRPSK